MLHDRVFGHVLHEISLLRNQRRMRVNASENALLSEVRRVPVLTEVYARPHMLQLYALAFLMACADRWICSDAESE